MTKETFKKGFAMIMACFPDKNFEPKAYFELLGDLPGESFIKAVKEVCFNQEEIYPGTNIVSVIRKRALIKPRLTSGEAWEQVLGQLNIWETDRPKFADPLVAKTVSCIGWNALYYAEKPSIERSNFMKVYDSLADRAEKEDVLSLPAGDKKQIGDIKKLVSGVADGLESK